MKPIIIVIILTAITGFGMNNAKNYMDDLVAHRAVVMAQLTK